MAVIPSWAGTAPMVEEFRVCRKWSVYIALKMLDATIENEFVERNPNLFQILTDLQF